MNSSSRGEAATLVASDLLLLLGNFALAYALRFHLGLLAVTEAPPPSPLEYLQAYGVAALVFVLVFRARGLYQRVLARGIDTVEAVTYAVTTASVILLATSFFDRSFTYSRSVFLLIWALSLPAHTLPRLAILARRRARYDRGEGLTPALIVGSSPRARDLYDRLSRFRRYGINVLGLVRAPDEVARAPEAAAEGAPKVWGALEDLDALVAESGAQEVLLAADLEHLTLFETLERCERAGIEVRIVPHTLDLFVTASDLSEVFGVPFVSVREERREWLSLALKRVFDLAVATILLALCLPLLAFLAALVTLGGGGSPLFRQRRIGQGGEVFGMWKLRSMVPDAEAQLENLIDLGNLDEPVYKLHDDPRVTRVGRVLRRWSLDELPQLFNVVTGDMSLVGPRPEVESVVKLYNAHHRRRLKAKPGLTGLQQIHARGSTDLEERISLDVYYTRRRSFVFDLWILARTPWAVLLGRGAR